MKEYIEREAAIAVIYGQIVGGKEACENARTNTYGADLREIVADIEDIPAADVRPVVLCRDCYAYRRDKELAEAAYLDPKMYCGLLRCEMGEDSFCSYGVKRAEDETT